MWKAATPFLALMVLVPSTAPVAADAHNGLKAGSYEIEVRLELPFLDTAGAKKAETICVTADKGNGTHGLAVLSENNPLAKCPASNIHQNGNMLTFDIVCPGGNAARASATYTLAAETFKGRIAMKMGGKNMTMTEIQTGHRTGDCAVSDAPRS